MDADPVTAPVAAPAAALVLVYHAVTTSPGRHIAPFAVTPRVFADQLDALVTAGYRCLTLSGLVEELDARAARGEDGGAPPLAAVTVDDGYADFAQHAAPALAARSLPSTLYVTTGWLAGRGPAELGPDDAMLDWRQLPDLVAGGVEVGAHSHRHPQMDTLSRAAARDELQRPKDLLEDVLAAPVRTFAYPHGYSGPRVRRLAREAGYASATGVRNALTRAGDDRYGIARLMVAADTAPERFADWLAQRDTPVATDGEALRTRGWRAVRRGRAVLRRAPGSDYR